MSTVFEQILERGKEIGIKEGEERGEERGEKKSAFRVALNCLRKGMDIQTISEITGLSVERIERLKTAVQDENTSQR